MWEKTDFTAHHPLSYAQEARQLAVQNNLEMARQRNERDRRQQVRLQQRREYERRMQENQNTFNQQVEQRRMDFDKRKQQLNLYSEVDDLVRDLRQARVSSLRWREEQLRRQSDRLVELEALKDKYQI